MTYIRFVLVLLEGGMGSICSWEGSWALVELNDSIVFRKTSAIRIGK
jgi:hypothetical protein